MVENILNGLLLGGLYLACGKNLAVPVIRTITQCVFYCIDNNNPLRSPRSLFKNLIAFSRRLVHAHKSSCFAEKGG
jgi:hypothetical protein